MRSSVLDMFVVVVADDMTEYAESNALVLLTCNTYVIYDKRSPSERARVDVMDAVARLRRDAIEDCKRFALRLASCGDKASLELMYNRLANDECRRYVESLMDDNEFENGSTKIEI